MAVLQAAAAELYRLALAAGRGIIEIIGAVEPAGLLGANPHVLSREVLKLGRLVLIDATERRGAYVKKDVVLRTRFRLEQYGALRFGLGQ